MNLGIRPEQALRVSEQGVACPRCGGFSTRVSMLWRDRRTGDLFQGQQEVPISYIVVLFAVLAMASIFVIGRLLGVDATGLGLGISGLTTLFVLAAYFWRGVKRENESVRLNVYKCGRCLHEWTWAEGRPQPEYRQREETWEEYKASSSRDVDCET